VPLADGNIGIGGLPAWLLYRCAQLLAPDGRLLIEAEPGNVDEMRGHVRGPSTWGKRATRDESAPSVRDE
jgi:hypothetical protein